MDFKRRQRLLPEGKDVKILLMTVKQGYVNPLTVVGQKKSGSMQKMFFQREKDGEKKVQDLQNRKQTIQNQILLIKSASDGAVMSEKSQAVLEEQLEEIVVELKTAKSEEAGNTGKPELNFHVETNFDIYRNKQKETEHPGVYQVIEDEQNGYKVIFAPYSE